MADVTIAEIQAVKEHRSARRQQNKGWWGRPAFTGVEEIEVEDNLEAILPAVKVADSDRDI